VDAGQAQGTSVMRIAIYGPTKNQAHHVQPWYDSCKDADVICVADTGSTDGTKEKMIDLGVQVTDVRIVPWRFDDAFNTAMYLVPDDIDVCIRLDTDERLTPGWRDKLEAAWKPETTRLRYPYIWNWNADGTPGRQWYGDRIHSRKGYRWMGATHEGLVSRLPEVHTFTDDFQIHHFPDTKSKSGDLSLLEESVREWPHDARIKAYLGREYAYQKIWDKCAATYKEFLGMSYDTVERCQALTTLAQAEPENKLFWLKQAAYEVPTHREPLVALAQHYYEIADWKNCYDYAHRALKVTKHPMDYTCTPEAWGWQPHDLLSIAAWNLKLYDESLEQAKLALDKLPNDKRLQDNMKLIEDFIAKNLRG
jgi:glycosyltransferase involved in cell wall biosynthesis